MRALIIGCGYLGRRVADQWMAAGLEVHALTRSTGKARELKEGGIRPVVGDVLDLASLDQLPRADTLVYAVGHDRNAARTKHDVYVNGLKNVLSAMTGRMTSVIYISSISVYGQSDGSWIDEASDCDPSTENGRICLEAEQALEASAETTTTLRLAGLYGPGRLIGRLDQLRAATPVPGTPDAWLNLIHVDDAARCVVACGDGRARRPVYLVADDEPVRRGEFYAELARRAGVQEPSFDPQSATGGRVTGLGKRCRNALMHRDLVEDLQYPDFRSGLASGLSPH